MDACWGVYKRNKKILSEKNIESKSEEAEREKKISHRRRHKERTEKKSEQKFFSSLCLHKGFKSYDKSEKIKQKRESERQKRYSLKD